MATRHPDADVPEREHLACLLWKCHHSATYGIGDGSVTWNTLQPVERSWWIKTAENFTDSAWHAEQIAKVKAKAFSEVEKELGVYTTRGSDSSPQWPWHALDRARSNHEEPERDAHGMPYPSQWDREDGLD
jgi:hypothetical protein